MSSHARLPFWSDGIRFECQETGQCCASRGEYGYIYLTGKDERRLAAHLDLSREKFRAQYCDFTDGWLHLKHPELDCGFLDGTCCGVYEGRPQQCRTWPFWSENLVDARTWSEEVASFCPGIGKGRLHSLEEIRAILRGEGE